MASERYSDSLDMRDDNRLVRTDPRLGPGLETSLISLSKVGHDEALKLCVRLMSKCKTGTVADRARRKFVVSGIDELIDNKVRLELLRYCIRYTRLRKYMLHKTYHYLPSHSQTTTATTTIHKTQNTKHKPTKPSSNTHAYSPAAYSYTSPTHSHYYY